MTNPTRLASTDELESVFQRELATDRWAAAETAYALAVRHRDLGDRPASREWAQQCLRLLEGFPGETEEQVATSRTSVGGVQLPTYLHSGVVEERFGALG
ncbi:hypothetical protein GTY81_12025 [Streptomyces sp. SID8366]|uniref:hypothetical protein n=1 Tax=unclassified Streptomyces TaxID=2593676 RepID=UPI000DB9DABC|nr:hypothetical protein [Streptomyces sp. PsTaAH-130]MYU04600.1 hypothetical protein [Streptomyces sp. SID8366]MYU62192.1 hypothetical protein [Streptomyces sp. SID69]RAJ58489.1 hypothetical protein K376_03302 [Streptomyces sp. PsTaAH-130]